LVLAVTGHVRREVLFMVSRSSFAVPTRVLFIGLIAPGLALAQQQPPPDTPSTPVSPVVITATRIPTTLDQIASSITLITGQEIEDNQWRTLPDVLNDVPGLNVVQTGGPGGQTSVFIRGADANHTKVLIDGIDVNDPSAGVFDFGQMLTSNIARVEVLRGPEGSLYGPDALGGVINIVTREGSGPPRLTASLEGGSFDTLNETANISGSTGRFSYSADIAHFLSGDTPVTPPGLLAPGEARIGDSYDNTTASTKLGFALTPDASLHLIVRYTDDDLRVTGENETNFPDDFPDAAQTVQKSRQLFTRGEARFTLFNGDLKNVLGVGYTDYSTTSQSPNDGLGLPPPSLAAGNRIKLDYQGTLTLPASNTLVLGAEDDEDRLLASPVNASDSYRAGYLELQSHPLAGLSLTTSVRYDNDDRFGGFTTWRVAPTYLIAATGTQLKATYGTGFTAPTLTQLFVSFPSFDFFSNPNLKPETSQGYDIGFEQPFARNRLRFGATWFDNDIKNLIDDNADFTSFANVGRATTYGVESFISAAVTSRLSLRADYTYTIARDDIADQALLRRPKDKASLAATWRATHRFSVSGSLLYVGAWVDGNRDFSIPRLMASPYATVNVATAYDLGHGVTLFARIDNLLNRQYQNPVGFDKPGIGAFGGVKVSVP
jgi:vitamin B12 transporter